jgi:hypothetical protein
MADGPHVDTADDQAKISIPVVQLESGAVLLAPLEAIKKTLDLLRNDVADRQRKIAEQTTTRDDRLAEIGAAMIAERGRWDESPLDPELVTRCAELLGRADEDDAEVEALKHRSHTGVSGLLHRVVDSVRERNLEGDKQHAAAQLRPLLIQLAQTNAGGALEDVRALMAQVRQLESGIVAESAQMTENQSKVTRFEQEIRARERAIAEMGFDCLYVAAYLTKCGPQPIETALMLHAGEQAYVGVPARLARHRTRTHYVGSSSGLSFPIGHTGIRYRVGSYRGHPVSEDVLAEVDQGQLVVTSQRIAFVGSARSTSIPLAKLLHVEVYTDGIGVFKEGKEAADIYLVDNPKYVLLYLNFVLDQTASRQP